MLETAGHSNNFAMHLFVPVVHIIHRGSNLLPWESDLISHKLLRWREAFNWQASMARVFGRRYRQKQNHCDIAR